MSLTKEQAKCYQKRSPPLDILKHSWQTHTMACDDRPTEQNEALSSCETDSTSVWRCEQSTQLHSEPPQQDQPQAGHKTRDFQQVQSQQSLAMCKQTTAALDAGDLWISKHGICTATAGIPEALQLKACMHMHTADSTTASSDNVPKAHKGTHS